MTDAEAIECLRLLEDYRHTPDYFGKLDVHQAIDKAVNAINATAFMEFYQKGEITEDD